MLDINISPTIAAGTTKTYGSILRKGDQNIDVTTVDQADKLFNDHCANVCSYERTVEINGNNDTVNITGDRYTKLDVQGTGNTVTQNGVTLTDNLIMVL